MQHNQRIKNVLFEPILVQKSDRRDGRLQDTTGGMQLGIVVEHLMAATTLIHSELPFIDSLIKKAAMAREMSTADLKKVFFAFKIKINILNIC